MDNLYEHIEKLAKERGYRNITEFCRVAEIPRATMSELKAGRTKRLSADTLSKIAIYLSVSVDYLLTGLYKSSVAVYTNGICAYTGSTMQEIETQLAEKEPGSFRIVYRGPGVVVTVDTDSSPSDDQIDAVIAIYDTAHVQKEKAPAEKGERSVSDDEIKFALFRGREDITDAMYEEVLNFAEYVARREEERKKKE